MLIRRLSLLLGGVLCAFLFVPKVEAATRTYQAGLDNSVWRVSEYSALQCTLAHDIPRYGEVRFESQASRELNMRVVLQMKRQPDSYQNADVFTVAPAWRQHREPQKLGQLPLYRQYDSELGKEMAWILLSELEQGMNPLFSYQDWYNKRDQVKVQVSAVNFQKRYTDFLDCVAQLLPYSFEDIAFTVLNYEERTTELTASSKRKLLKIGEYLKHDKNIELVLLSGHTDSYGSYDENEALSLERAQAIRNFLVEAGLEKENIKVQGYGEMRHVAGNDTELERDKNRRVVVQMSRPFSKDLLSSK